ncbi:MAG: DUF4835 family protein [Chitinophagaceae bacterium]
MKLIQKLAAATICLCIYAGTYGQELNAKVTVLSQKVSTQVDKKIFNTLQTQLTNLLNNRKWTGDNFKSNERIECSFLLNIDREVDKNVYAASLTVQAARPIYNSSYNSPLINFQDNDVTFKYLEFQPVEFNESRIQGSDGLVSNITAVFAYYVDLILGMDYESFAQGAGEPYFKKMLNIVNNAPEGRDIKGWTQFDGVRNRYWLAENFVNTRYALIHEAFYNYYRTSLDNWYDNEQTARQQMMQVLNSLGQFAAENQNTMIMQFFMQGKSDELIKMFKKSPPDERIRVIEILQKVDITNVNKYREGLK